MITTTRKECFVRVEMTEEQARVTREFLAAIQERHIIEISNMANLDPVAEVKAADCIADLRLALKDGIGQCTG